jgi:hypothetical protein
MKRVLLGLAACVLGLSLTAGAATAGGYYGTASVRAGYYQNNAIRFSGGYYYRGYNHNHWSARTWNASTGCWNYYDPHLHCSYYWHAGHGCYYPTSYCP